MGRNAIETVLGAVVLIVAGVFLVFAYSSADLQKVQGYMVSAYFPKVDGLKEGTDVKMNGVKVGSVSGMQLVTEPGPHQYKVNVQMTLLPDVVLPLDTIAMIASESLLGGKYMSLEVGVDEENIKTDGTGRITHTQSPMRLDDLIGQLIYGSKKSENGNGAQSKNGSSSGSSMGATPPPAVTASPAPAESVVQPPPQSAPAPRPAPPVASPQPKAAPAPAKSAPPAVTAPSDGVLSTLQPPKPKEGAQVLEPPKPRQETPTEAARPDAKNPDEPSPDNLPPANISVLPPLTLPAPHDPAATPPEPAKQ